MRIAISTFLLSHTLKFFSQIVCGHSKQLWGLAVHPDDELFATAGHDKTVALWKRNKLVWSIQVRVG